MASPMRATTSTEVTLLIPNKAGENTKDDAAAASEGVGDGASGWGWRRIAGPVALVAVVGVLGVLGAVLVAAGGDDGSGSLIGGGIIIGRGGGVASLGDAAAAQSPQQEQQQQKAFSFSDAQTGKTAPGSPERYASDPLFQEFRVQPKEARAVDDKSFLLVTETNYAFAGLACNWLRSVTKQVGVATAKKAIVVYVTGQKGEETKQILQSCSGGALRAVFLRDADAPATPEHWGTKGYFKSTTRKPEHLFEAFQLARSAGFKHMLFNDVDVAWKADLRKNAPRVDGFAAQNVEIGQPQVCSGVLIANAASEEAKTIFQEWIALTDVVIREGKMTKENRIVYKGKTYCGDEDVLNALVLDAMPPYEAAVEAKYGDVAATIARNSGMRTRRHTFQLLSPELAPNGRYARGADPKYADEDASNPILVDKRYSDGAHFREGASVIHVNWCVGLERKVAHLRDYGLWFLTGEETKRLLGIDLPAADAANPALPVATAATTAAASTPVEQKTPIAVAGMGQAARQAVLGGERKKKMSSSSSSSAFSAFSSPVATMGEDMVADVGGVIGGGGWEAVEGGCRVLFATYPNSGTSWMEQMWSEASDVGAETVYTSYYPNQWQTAWKTTFDTTVMSSLDRGDNLRVANHARGECSMIKSHELPDFYQQTNGMELKGDGRLPYLGEYHKVIVVRRNEEDNVAANLRFFQKTKPDCAISLGESKYFELFAAREKLVYQHWHCGWQKLEDDGVQMMRVNYEDLIANPTKELRHLRNFLNFKNTVPDARIKGAAAKYPPLKKGEVFTPSARLDCGTDLSQLDLIAQVNALTKKIKALYSCDASMSWMLHSGQVAKDDVDKNNLASAAVGEREEESDIPAMAMAE